jgi:putative membrane protein
MMYWDHGWGWGAWVAMGLMMLAFWAVIAALVVVALRSPWHHHDEPSPTPQPPRGDAAMRILDERFARGEIDEQEYRAKREVLGAR